MITITNKIQENAPHPHEYLTKELLRQTITQETKKYVENNQIHHQKTTSPQELQIPDALTTPQAEDNIEYADDINLYIQDDTTPQTITRLQNYELTTKSRQLLINWDKVKLLIRTKLTEQEKALPEPFNHIQTSKYGMALGKILHMKGHQNKAVMHRLTKAKQVWGRTKNKLFKNNSIPEKLRIQLWNAIIRSTLIYALSTQQLNKTQQNKLNQFLQTCMRHITQNTWYTIQQKNEKKHTQKKNTPPQEIYTQEQNNPI